MERCFCACHQYPGVYSPPCGVCGHDDREGHMIRGLHDGWMPNEPRRMTRQEWQSLKVQDFERLERKLKIATEALDAIVMRGHDCGAWVVADDALTQVSVMSDDGARALDGERVEGGQTDG